MRISGTLVVILSLLLALIAFSGCELGENTVESTIPDETNDPPTWPSLVYPYVSAGDMSIKPTFIWICTDPEDDDLLFTIHLNTIPSSTEHEVETTDYSYVWDGDDLAPETTYIWYVEADDGTNDPVSSSTRVFATGTGYNNPPVKPYDFRPRNNQTDVEPEEVILTWDCYDPDGDPLVYDVCFDAAPDYVLVSEGQSERSYNAGALEYNKQYCWHITARDDQEGITNSSYFLFTTEEANNPPAEPSEPDPADDEPAASLEASLSWTCSDPDGDPLTYDVWFGPPLMELLIATGISETFVNVEGLRRNTEYSWSVTAYDNDGGETHGPFWTFTTVNEVYVELEVIRNISNYYGTVTRDDQMRARFDAAYAPGAAIEPLQPFAVKGGAHNLYWLDYEQFYFYRDPQNDPFLTLGSSYTFVVSSNAEIDYLQTDVDMPACEHYFTSPDMNTGVSLSGFTVEWYSSCPGTGDVDIYVRNGLGDDTGIHIIIPNVGFYTFSSGQLSGLTGSFELFVDIIAEEWYPIDEAGYYNKSFWRGKVTSTLMLYVM